MIATHLRTPIHTSWLIAWLSTGVVAGVALVPVVMRGNALHVAWVGVALVVVGFSLFRARLWVVPLVIAAGLIVGLTRGGVLLRALDVYVPLYKKTLTIRAVVSDDPAADKQGNTTLQLADISVDSHALSGKLWISTTSERTIHRGDTVVLSGVLEKGFGTFSGVMYRAKIVNVTRPSPPNAALEARDWFAGKVREAIPEPEASLGVGYLVGQRSTLPADLDAALKTAGLTHIVVASGYNLTILVRLARRLFEKVSKYLAVLASGTLIVGFIGVTGLSPSMTRAGLVTGLSLLAWYYGRKFHPLVLLPFAAAITVLIDPSYVWGDLGWLLSFTSFAGVMILAPLLQAYYFGDKKPGVIRQILGETISASLMTAPILILSFGYISNVAIPANLLILPFVPLAMLLTFIAGIGAVVVGALAAVVGFPAYLLLSYMTATTHFFADLSWAKSDMTIGPWIVLLMYGLLGGFMGWMMWRTRLNLRDSNIVE